MLKDRDDDSIVARGSIYTLLQSTSTTNCFNNFWYAILEVIQGPTMFIWFCISAENLSGLVQMIFFQFLGILLIRPNQLNTCKLVKSYFCFASAQLSG